MKARKSQRRKLASFRRSQKRKFLKKKLSLVRPGRGLGFHQAILGLANHGAHAGYSRDYVYEQIREIADEGTREVPDEEIWDAVDKACDELESELLGKRRVHDFRKPTKKRLSNVATHPQKRKITKEAKVSVSRTDIVGAINTLTAGIEYLEEDITKASPVKISPLSSGVNLQLIQVLQVLFSPL